jgi:signal transduction histidine kinase
MATIDAQEIRADRYAEIGTIVQRDASLIVDRWTRRAAIEQPQGKGVHHAVLLDHLPHLLRELGRGLAEYSNLGAPRFEQSAAQHGEQRWESGWSLSELVHDYRLLRLVLLQYLDEVLDRPLELREVLAVGLALDDAIDASVDTYVRFCEEQSHAHVDALQAAGRRKNEFLATLAHELRNPLAPLRNCVDIMRLNESDIATVRQVREIMDRQVQQMSRLLEDLLDVSRIELGKLDLQKGHVDLRSALTQAVQTSAPGAQSRRHDVSVVLPPEPLWVEGDQARLVQVFVNLLNNATRYTPQGGGISVTAAKAGAEVVVSVKDTGIGIAPDMLPRVFELFARAAPDADDSGIGLGIGLALVHRLVDLHGGTIEGQSAGLGQGSEFIVRLPLAAAPAAMPPRRATIPRTGFSRRILLVEDNSDARTTLALLLRLVGHEVTVAEDGRRAIEAAVAGLPQVALVDIGLPDMDGYGVARQLRSRFGDQVFLVALTGFGQPAERQRAIDAGFNEHLVKPVQLAALQELLASLTEAN